VAEGFADGLVDLGSQALAAKFLLELCFDHDEGSFDIRGFVIMLPVNIPATVCSGMRCEIRRQ
jgi:hypothetical protein